MPDVNLRHEIDCDEDTFWNKCFFDGEYLKRLFLEHLKFPGYKVLEQKDDGKILTRRLQADPPTGDMPAAVKKVMGDSFTYIEEGSFDHATKRYKFNIIPSTFANKSHTAGEVWCEKIGDKKIARVAKVNVEVKVFMVGGIVEQKIVADLKSSYDLSAKFTNEFVREKGY